MATCLPLLLAGHVQPSWFQHPLASGRPTWCYTTHARLESRKEEWCGAQLLKVVWRKNEASWEEAAILGTQRGRGMGAGLEGREVRDDEAKPE
jgi:hypothetical protein